MRRSLVLLAACLPGLAAAQFKCVSPAGAVSFQQTPCAGTQKQEPLRLPPGATGAVVVVPKPAPSAPIASASSASAPAAAASAPFEPNADKRLLAKIEKDKRDQARAKRIAEIEGTARGIDMDISRRNVEIEALTRAAGAERRPIGSTLSESDWAAQNSRNYGSRINSLQAANDSDLKRLELVKRELEAARQAP